MPSVTWKQAIGEQTGEYREINSNYAMGAIAGGLAALQTAAPSASHIESHPNGTLAIARVAQEHAGNLLCQASNGIGADLSKLIRLTVHGECLVLFFLYLNK